MRYYKEFVLGVLGRIDNVKHIDSIFVMSEVKHTTTLPLGTSADSPA